MPFFSIVTIVFNDVVGLQGTQKSVASQSFNDFEWIIVDGGSSDGTSEYARSLAGSGAVVVSEPDDGIYDAMSKGLSLSSGRYVVFMNAGDVFSDSGVLSCVHEAALKSGADFLYGDSQERFSAGELLYKKAKGHMRFKYGMFGCHQSMYYRKEFLSGLTYDRKYRVAGDYAFTVSVLMKKPVVSYINGSLSIFDLSGVSNKNKKIGRSENWLIQRDIIGASLLWRLFCRASYVLSALLSERLPVFYKILRFGR